MYLAAKNGWSVALVSSDDMDSALAQGKTILHVDDATGEEETVATPEDGYLVEKPSFGPAVARSASADAERVLSILITGEDNG